MQRLPESELDVMLALWDSQEKSVPRGYFDRTLERKNWSVNALNSFLSRLEEKGFITSVKEGKNKYYSPVIQKDDYLSREGKSILHKLYNNSLKSFVLSVSDYEKISDDEIDELQEYLEMLKEERNNGR